ncbi:Signal transduction histidine kinase [Acetitomaculum ruminis DSM 5522]|uniref:histidine kinase n=1 Tax=Acetitomaculum ruminis DSM 5522 TaxID=1120918 RepID=A0A1I0W645_9FIRM|nr:HAMP domain-containing sensor histidine kinase [Acetitomaculum ruminis]SFA84031.1 Signal transduction histidine kinase [Acetitomaculum ruminis DSM 5522]
MSSLKTYSSEKKFIAICFQVVATVAIFVSLYIILSCFDRKLLSDDILNDVDYTETDYFEADIKEQISDLLEYLQYCRDFETNGIYDVSKLVDLENYIEDNVITGIETKSVGYTISDLLEWSNKSISYNTYYYNLEETDADTGLPRLYSSEEMSTMSDDAWDTYVDSIELIEDEYYPVEGMGLIDLYNSGYFKSVDELVNITNYLVRSIRALPQDINFYKERKTAYKEENSNLVYYIKNNITGVLYTNMDNATEPEKQISAMGKYVCIDSKNVSFTGNLNDIEKDLYSKFDNAEFLSGYDYTIYIGIDTALLKQDALYEAKQEYTFLKPAFLTCVIILIISVVIEFSTMGYIILTAGYKDSNKVPYTKSFDHLTTEISAGLIITGALIVVYFAFKLVENIRLQESSNVVSVLAIIVISVAVFIIDLLFVVGIMSLIRRYRSHILWKNSICYRLTIIFRKTAERVAINVRTMVSYILFVLVGIFLAVQVATEYDLIAVVLMVILYVYVGIGLLRVAIQKQEIIDGLKKIKDGDINFKINNENMNIDNTEICNLINGIGEGFAAAVEDSVKNERLKSELITNVSHDIKTPLTSIINYVNLLKRENIEDEKIKGYIDVLDKKSMRLKHLTDDLVEASKISAGKIDINIAKLDFREFINQTAGEFSERFEEKKLSLVMNLIEGPVYIMADGRRLWRVIENLYNNIAKYALENTRVYADLIVDDDGYARFSIKNISSQQLNIKADELTERFIRGDVSRGSEGSGLGLSIAKNLTKLQDGEFEIYLDGDLFKATVGFKEVKEEKKPVEIPDTKEVTDTKENPDENLKEEDFQDEFKKESKIKRKLKLCIKKQV